MDEDEPMTVEPKRIAENTALVLISRLSMALCIPLFSLLGYIYWQYLDTKFDVINNRVTVIESKADSASDAAVKASDLAGKANDRLTAVETRQTSDANSSDKFQASTLARLDRIQESLVELSNTVSALTATLQTMVKDRDVNHPPLH